MYDLDRPKFIFVTLLEDFIRETEHSLAYFFALLVFLLTFLLALFGREALYTGLIGVLCLFLIKLRDIVEGFRETSLLTAKEKKTTPSSLKKMQNSSFDDASLTAIEKEFPYQLREKSDSFFAERRGLLSYLNTCWKIIETLSLVFPDQPLRPETRKAIKRMIVIAQKHLQYFLKRKYALTKEQTEYIEKIFADDSADNFLLQTRLEKIGIDEKTAQWTIKVIKLLKKIENSMTEGLSSPPLKEASPSVDMKSDQKSS